MKPTAYEGNENYIFISYAHKDNDKVFEVLRELEEDGYRFWYDDGIVPGSEWPEDIAMHLTNARMVIAFITPNAVASPNCRREINYSLSMNKPFLSVILEETKMSPGLEMQLSAQQSVIRYNYDNWDAFINKIKRCPDLAPCLKAPAAPVQTVAETAQPVMETAQTAAEPVQPAAEPVQPVMETVEPAAEAAPVMKETPATAAGETAASVVRKESKREKKSREKAAAAAERGAGAPKKKGRAGLIAFAAAVLLIAVFLMTRSEKVFETSWGERIAKSTGGITVKQQTVTQEDLNAIADCKELLQLSFTGCDFSGCDFSGVTFSSGGLSRIEFHDCTGIGSYAFLGNMDLKTLIITGDQSFTDLSVTDVSQLTTLDISGTGVSDLSPAAGSTKLKKLYAAGSKVTSLDAVVGFENLTELDLSGCDLKSVNGSVRLKALRLAKLNVSDSDISDLGAFSDCTVLTDIDVSGNSGLTSMDWMDTQNYATLEVVDVSGSGLDRDALSFIEKCNAITSLNVRGLALDDLSFCARHSTLTTIMADGCGITDISALKSCPNLQTVLLSFNNISDISVLSGVTPSYDVVIDLSFNGISDASALQPGEYRAVLLIGNDAEVVSTLQSGVKGYEILCDHYDGIGGSAIADKESFTRIYMVGCPASDQVNQEESIGKNRLVLTTYDELYDMLVKDELFYSVKQDYADQAELYRKAS